jgi:hypothetical protein
MKTKILFLGGAMAMLVGNCPADSPHSPKPQVFEWTNRLELSVEQQKLLHMHTSLSDQSYFPEKRPELEADAKRLSEKLGSATVRHAKPEELIITGERTGVATIINPSSDNVAFTVSVRGDEKRMGTRMASIGRLTYLPPKGVLRVPNLYWTTPRMTHED